MAFITYAQRFVGRLQVRREAAFIADAGAVAGRRAASS